VREPARIAVIDFGGQYAHLIAKQLRHRGSFTTILPPDCAAEDLAGLKGIVLSGGPASVDDPDAPPWNPALLDQAAPVLGLCYGHQLLAHAFGGEVGDNPKGTQEGTTTVQLTPEGQTDALLGALGVEAFDALVSHAQSALALPPGATRLAFDDWDANQAFRIGKNAWGVQFHPEMDADIACTYIRAERDELLAQGQNPDQILAAVRETPLAAEVLRRFARLALENK